MAVGLEAGQGGGCRDAPRLPGRRASGRPSGGGGGSELRDTGQELRRASCAHTGPGGSAEARNAVRGTKPSETGLEPQRAMEALEERASRDQSRVILERPGTVQSQPELVHRGQKAL